MRLTIPRWGHSPSQLSQSQFSQFFHTPYHDRRRRDIASSELCKAAIDLLRPSLPPPGTCDVIDINPGASVWSEALHHALKPRRHVLVDLERQTYDAVLAPLLKSEGSAYRFTPTITDALDPSKDLLSPELRGSFNNASKEEKEDMRRTNNHQLIITGNLAGRKLAQGAFSGDFSKMFVNDFHKGINLDWGQFEMHRYGLVRMLVWLPEHEKHSINPRSAYNVARLSKLVESSCDLRELVSAHPNYGMPAFTMPWYGAAMKSLREVARRQRHSKITVPKDRKQPPPEPPSISISPDPENFDALMALELKPPLVSEYINTWEQVMNVRPDIAMQHPKQAQKPDNLSNPEHLALWQKYRLLRNRMTTTHNRYEKVEQLALEQNTTERSLITIRRNNPHDPEPYDQKLAQLLPLFDTYHAQVQAFFKDNRASARKAIDDYRFLNTTPRALPWLNRAFEPLLCKPADFYPCYPLALLELSPKPSFATRFSSTDKSICLDYVMQTFDLNYRRSVHAALERLLSLSAPENPIYFLNKENDDPDSSSGANNGVDDEFRKFVRSVPRQSLIDPLLGGYHNLERLGTHNLPAEVLCDVAEAYESWPRRRPTEKILQEMGRGFTGKWKEN